MDAKLLAGLLALRAVEDYPAGTCVAWMDAADKVCGRAASPYLCGRHEKVAARRLEKLRAEHEQDQARAAQRRAEREPRLRDELQRIEARLDRIDPLRTDTRRDPAMVNLPLSTRLPSDARIAELARLHLRRDSLRRLLGDGS